MPPSFFRTVDAERSNPLHTLLESSRDLDAARFLLSIGVDGFAKNSAGRSPLSMAIETMPSLALELLNSKSRFEYRWWGKDLYWFSFGGIVLPELRNADAAAEYDSSALAAAVEAAAAGDGEGVGAGDGGAIPSAIVAMVAAPPSSLAPPAASTPASNGALPAHAPGPVALLVKDGSGQPVSIEELILRHDRKELLETPVMLDLLERKWDFFAGQRYRDRFIIFAAMVVSVFVSSVGEPGTPLFYTATASSAITWLLFCNEQVRRLRATLATPRRRSSATDDADVGVADRLALSFASNFFDALDAYNLALVPIVTASRLAADAGVAPLLEGDATLATLAGALQVTLALSMLNLVALFPLLGPLLITVVQVPPPCPRTLLAPGRSRTERVD